MSYNIWDGGGAGGGRLDAVLEVIRRQAPDVLALQECNGFSAAGSRTRYRFERELDMRSFLAEARSGYHVALLVRGFDVEACHPQAEPFHHASLRVHLRRGELRLTVLVAHLCPFSPEARSIEAQYLATHARGELCVLMGDLNAIAPSDADGVDPTLAPAHRRSRYWVPGTGVVDARVLQTFESVELVDLWRRAHPLERGCSYPTPLVDPSGRLALRLDYILATQAAAAAMTSCEIVTDARTMQASDHYPVVAELKL